jgi:phospholipid/cholesterol/gamma-HCH transport system substrate-binding protein
MREQAVRFRLGIFVLSTLILLAVLIVLFGGRPTWFQPTDTYIITFDNAPGVVPGTPVRRSGVKIGEVESVTLDNDTGQVNVGVRIDQRYNLRKGDEAVLQQNLLGGDAAIDFVPPRPEEGKEFDKTPLPPGSLIAGKTHVGPGEVVQEAGKVLPPTEESMKEMAKLLRKLDKMTPLMEETLKEYRDLGKTARELVPEFKTTNKEIQKFVKSANELVPEFKDTNKELKQLVKSANKSIPEFNRTLEEFQLTARNWSKLGERLDLLVQTNEKKFSKALDDLSKTLEEMSKVFSKENQEAITEILKNSRTASKQFDSMTKNMNEVLLDSRKTLAKFNEVMERADRVVNNLDRVTGPMAERSPAILKNLDEATAQLNKAMAEFRFLMQGVATGQGTVYKLLNDQTLYNRLNEAAATANKVLPRLDHVLQDMETFADKIARHPELLGVGGAIRPSSGLKDLPPYPIIWKGFP